MWLWIGVMAALALPMEDLRWRVVNDTVMGGRSRASVEIEEMLRFQGTLSLERNGGFASIRARTPAGAFEDATALRLVVQGDGRTYDFTIERSDIPLRAGSYRMRFPTEVGTTEILLPLAAFRPTSFGREVAGAPALDTALDRIDGIGIMLADKQEGDFALEVLELDLVTAAPTDTEVRRTPLLRELAAAIDEGVPAFNAGDVVACRNRYMDALMRVRARPGLTLGEHSLIDEAIGRVRTQEAREAAWTLRAVMDSILFAGA